MTKLYDFVVKTFSCKKFYIVMLLICIFSVGFFPVKTSSGKKAVIAESKASSSIISDQESSTQDFLDATKAINQIKSNTISSTIDTSKPIRFGQKDVKKVALTFDDGPYALTEKYLDVLKDHKVNATFFVLGTQVNKYPNQAKMIAESGFEIGTHSHRHKQLTKIRDEAIYHDISMGISAINEVTKTDVKLFRPPYGDVDSRVLGQIEQHDLVTILWSIDPRDWQKNNANDVARHVLDHAHDGAIILLHEGRKSTLEALPTIIKGLKEKGYEIVSVSELLSDS